MKYVLRRTQHVVIEAAVEADSPVAALAMADQAVWEESSRKEMLLSVQDEKGDIILVAQTPEKTEGSVVAGDALVIGEQKKLRITPFDQES